MRCGISCLALRRSAINERMVRTVTLMTVSASPLCPTHLFYGNLHVAEKSSPLFLNED